MLIEIELWLQPILVISLPYDSEAIISRAYNIVYNGKSRHISLRYEYVRELISNGIITISYVKSAKNLANPLIKPLPRDRIKMTTNGMVFKLKPLIEDTSNSNPNLY